jgi:PAS domain-containing protein
MVDPRDFDKAYRSVTEALEKKMNSNVMEVRTISKSGKVLNCLWYYSFVRDDKGELQTVLSFVTDITEQRLANYRLNERIKELTTLYNVSKLLTTPGDSMHSVFEKLPDLLPPGWQFPACCAARLTVLDNVFQTDNFNDTTWKQSVTIRIDKREVGKIEIVYLKKPSEENESVFLTEEDNLLRAIGQMVQVYIERKQKEDELRRTQANLTSAINNTEILIWSVDVNFNLIAFNEASRKFALERFKVDVTRNKTLNVFPEPVRTKWIDRYKRVLAGEILNFEEQLFEMDFKYSVSPIIENKNVIGAVVFVYNITEEKQQLRALTEANNKISELKVLTLRSVMNPHFIFNVLSSIQYFITKNDGLNAINYLTSFSKLMRAVLARSVDDAVTVSDEVELLKDYVHLEKLRFEDKFELLIDIDPQIGADDIRMPSLLVQPYVENAILHGLYNKEGKGLLKIAVNLTGEFLNFQVEDNGIGRAAAHKIQEKNFTKRKSMGTKLTEERLAMFNGDGKKPVTYTDLYVDDKPAGTLVTIRIKVNS